MKLLKIVLLGLFFLFPMDSHAYKYLAEITAYTHTGNPMANGEYPHVGAIASNDHPIGTKIKINGKVYTVKDRVGCDGVIDIFMDTHHEAIQWGRRYIIVEVLGR